MHVRVYTSVWATVTEHWEVECPDDWTDNMITDLVLGWHNNDDETTVEFVAHTEVDNEQEREVSWIDRDVTPTPVDESFEE